MAVTLPRHATAVLDLLTAAVLAGESEVKGQTLKDRLNAGKSWWRRWSGPAFYLLMAKLEDANQVWGWYDEIVIDGQRIKVRKCLPIHLRVPLGQAENAPEFEKTVDALAINLGRHGCFARAEIEIV
jgi:hypothetical protein